MENKRGWNSRIGLVLAVAGSAVGLGNFLRFPVQALQNGGGAFIIPYLTCFFLLAIPLMWMEWTIGRMGGNLGANEPAGIFYLLSGKNRKWALLGALSLFINLVVAGYYCYIESWALVYAIKMALGGLNGLSVLETTSAFETFIGVGSDLPDGTAIIAFLFTLSLNAFVLGLGLNKGIERVSLILMPLLLLIAIVVAIQIVSLDPSENSIVKFSGLDGLNYLWTPNFSALTNPSVWLAAAGQIFFTTAVGMGIVHTYSSYVKPKKDIALTAMASIWTNEFVEVVLGSAILLPLTVAFLGISGAEEAAKGGGLSLAFKVMPALFASWPGWVGQCLGSAFFLMLFFAGLTSSLAMGAPLITMLNRGFNFSPKKGAYSFGIVGIVLGLPCVLFINQGWLDEFDFWAGSFALVLFALLEVFFFLKFIGAKEGFKELSEGASIKVPAVYVLLIKWVVPSLLIVVLFASFVAPQNQDWLQAFTLLFQEGRWPFSEGSLVGKLLAEVELSLSLARVVLVATITAFIVLVLKYIKTI